MADFSVNYRMEPSATEMVSRFTFGEKVVKDQQRQRMSVLGRRLLQMVRHDAPSDSGDFAAGIELQMSGDADSRTRIEISTPSPLGKWIQEGTRPHVIRPRGNYPLRFYWANGPNGPGVYHFMSVNHPGTKANPFVARAYRKWLPEARREIQELGQVYARVIRSGAAAGQFGY